MFGFFAAFAFALYAVTAAPVNLFDWNCNNVDTVATVNQQMAPIICTCTTYRTPRLNPQLPVGMSYEIVANGNFKTITISGTPSVPQQTRTYSVGFKEYVSQIRIGVKGVPTTVSYGFDTMIQYVNVPIEPIPARSDAYLNQFSSSPLLPSTVILDPVTGTITGKFPDTTSNNQVYTITATNGMGSVSTTIVFTVKEASEMTMPGFIGCYWSGTTECRTPAFDYYYQNSAQFCQKETKLQYADDYSEGDGNTWPGLDERFRDYYTTYMYGYFNVLASATYTFMLNSDDASFLYIDSLDVPQINHDGCRGTSPTDDTVTLNLEQGRHLFVVKFLEVNGAAILYLRYTMKEAGNSAPVYVDSSFTKIGGRGPTFITYPLITGYANAEIKVFTPEMVSGGADSWQVNPVLPAGMSFDQYRGQIRGKPTAVYDGYHTVTATGDNGSASTVIHIIIGTTLLSGFRGQYYKVFDNEMCMYTNLAPSQMELKVVKTDAQINYPTSMVGVWPEMPTDFVDYFFVEWEGYLHFSEIGTWKIRAGCDDSCRVFGIENTLLIDSWTCGNFRKTEKSIPVSSIGYYYFKIRYQQKENTKGMVLEWQAPTGNYEVVPANKIFHAATSQLSYDYEVSHYFQNVEIPLNTPRLFSIASCTGYVSSPPLPSGISIQPGSGLISGIPTNNQVGTQYTITCQSPTGPIQTKIQFDVFYEMPPTGLFFQQNGMKINPGTVVQLIPTIQMNTISIAGSGSGISYTINPALPNGISLNPSSGSITGTPLQPTADISYTVVATNAGGIMALPIIINVSGCKGVDSGSSWTNDLYIMELSSGTASASVMNGNTEAQCAVNFDAQGNAIMGNCKKDFSYSVNIVTFCVKPQSGLQFKISCSDNQGCYSQVYRADGNRWPSRFTFAADSSAPYIDVYDFPTSLTPLTAVTLSETETNCYVGMPLNTISITPSGCFKSIKIEPSMGIDFSMNLAMPKIDNAFINGALKETYTITAEGDAGTASAMLVVHFSECGKDGKGSIAKFILTCMADASEMSYEIYNQKDSSVMLLRVGPYLVNGRTYTNMICAEVGDYKVIMKDTYGDAWTSGSTLKVYDSSSSLLQEFSFTAITGERIYYQKLGYFSVTSPSSATTVWKALWSGKVSKDWTGIDFNDASWSETTASVEYGEWSQTTVYFRTAFTVTDYIRFPLVQFGVWYRDGLVIYLNGNEVYRRNIQSGSINGNTYANAQYDGYYMRVGTAAGHLLKEGKNVIAIELHKHQTTTGKIQFSGYVNALQGECISRVDGGSITESDKFNQPWESSAAAWDRNKNTMWVENGIPAWTIYSYNFDRMEWVNRLELVSNLKEQDRDPSEFNLLGSVDGVNWDTLFHMKKEALFTKRGETKDFLMKNHLAAYGKYKFEIINTRNPNKRKASICVIDIQSCQLTYCVADGGFDGVMAGEVSIANCPAGSIGEMRRPCGLEALKPSWGVADMTECRSTMPPKKKVYIDVAYMLTDVTAESLMGELSDKFRIMVADAISIPAKTVEAWKVKDVSNEETQIILASAIWIRITADEEDASRLLKLVSDSITVLTEVVKNFHKDDYPEGMTISFYMKPVLQERKGLGGLSITLIVVMVVVVVIIASIIGFWIWVRTKSKKSKNGAKQLKAGTGNKVNAQHLSGKKDMRV